MFTFNVLPCPNCQGVDLYQYDRSPGVKMVICQTCNLIATLEAWQGGRDQDSLFKNVNLIARIRRLESELAGLKQSVRMD